VFLLGWVEFLGEEDEGLPSVLDALLQHAPMADVETSVTSASGVDGSGCDSRVARDKLLVLFEGLGEFRHSGDGVGGLDYGVGEHTMKS
jgi:hypothetical protein